MINADVAREDVSLVVERLCALGLDETGGISIEAVDASVSAGARRAMRDAEGFASDAVLWEQVEETVSESTELSASLPRLHGDRDAASPRSGSSPTRRS